MNEKYQKIYDAIALSAYRLVYDGSGFTEHNPDNIDIQRPLWLVLGRGRERLWISHRNGMYHLSRQDGRQFYFKTQRDFLPFLEKVLHNREKSA